MPSQRDIDRFHEAVEQGDFMAATQMAMADRSILRAKADHGDEPIHTACWAKQMMTAGLLIQQGVDVNAKGCGGMTPLHCAVNDAGMECIQLVALLIGAGADPSLKNDGGADVEWWARQEMTEGLEEILHILEAANPKDA